MRADPTQAARLQRATTPRLERGARYVARLVFSHLPLRVRWSSACTLERAEDCPDLHMGPGPAPCRAHIALVELGCNGIVAYNARPHNLLNNRADICSKLARIRLDGRYAALCNLR